MFRVSMLSGEELTTMSEQELGEDRTLYALKHRLREQHGFPVCLQSLLHDGMKLEDHLELKAPMDMQLLLLSVPGANLFEVTEELMDAAGSG